MYAMDAMGVHDPIDAIDAMWIYNLRYIYSINGINRMIEAIGSHRMHDIHGSIDMLRIIDSIDTHRIHGSIWGRLGVLPCIVIHS